jgi:hypothetical protein
VTHDDGALIWNDQRRGASRPPASPPGPANTHEAAAPPDSGAVKPPAASDTTSSPAVDTTERITLRVASERYGVSVSTLRTWCRSGQIDGILAEGPSGRRWMVTPSTVAERVAGGRRATSRVSEPEDSGAMLVPRAAWDKLMDQLGNLHEAGQQLAEARERAARFETEATFLRERLAELRAERDELRNRTGAEPEQAPPIEEPAGPVSGLVRSWRRGWSRFRE